MSRLRRLMPTPEQMQRNRWLRWIGPALYHPRLWHVSRRGVALGVAIGVFFGLLIPIAQIPFSAAAAVALRANVPAAAASTLVTNPITFPPVYYAAWWVGKTLLGESAAGPGPGAAAPAVPPADAAASAAAADADASWWQRTWHAITGVGQALLLGLALFSVTFGLLTYFAVDWLWQWRVRRKRRRRLVRSAG